MSIVLDLPDLPTDLFLMVTRYLESIDIVRCRLVSKQWYKEFVNEYFLRDILLREYGQAREVRALSDVEIDHTVDRPTDIILGYPRDVWKRTFDRVIARRQALESGKPRSVTKHDLRGGPTSLIGKQVEVRNYHIPVFPWNRYLRMPGQHRGSKPYLGLEDQAPTDLLETKWTYDSGLVVYPDVAEIQAYVLVDIEKDTLSIVPFDMKGRIVRRLRLKHNLLVFEWAEKEPYHGLNAFEDVYRHYVTAFDVSSAEESFPWLARWKITFRSEWKLDHFGFPLSMQDRWFSDHSASHFAVYIWQTNRSPWAEHEPIESLLIWDISQSSDYRPSDDPSGGERVSVGPYLVKKLSYHDLDFLTIRQRETPFLRKIALDGSACVYFFEEGCSQERGLHVGYGYETGRSRSRDVIWERVVGIPILGPGPRWEDRLGRVSTFGQFWPQPNFRKPNTATCWRYEGMGIGLRNQIVRDEWANIEYHVVQRTIGFPEVWVLSVSGSWCAQIDLSDIQWRWKRIDGDERYLIIQSNEVLHILHFDHDDGERKGKKRFLLASPAQYSER